MKKRALCLLLAVWLMVTVLPGFSAAAAESAETATAERQIAVEAADERIGGEFTRDLSDYLIQSGGVPIAYSVALDDIGVRDVISARIRSALLSRSAQVDVSDYEVNLDFCDYCFCGVINEHPELFYAASYTWSGYEKNGESIVTTINLKYKEEYTESDVDEFNSVCSEIMAGMPDGTDEEKLLYFHDYIISHCEYDLGKTKRDAYCALVGGSAVCQGYMLAFKHLCNLARLECECVISDSMNHGWNVVKLSDEYIESAYYYVDCTWDDPTDSANNRQIADSYCRHTYFLRNKETFMADHTSNDWRNGYGESVYNYTTTEKYEYGAGWWKDLWRPVEWVGGLMCYAKKNDVSHVYFRESGASTETAVEILGSGRWPAMDSPGAYYGNSFITVAALDGSFYYSTPTQVWKLTPGGDMSLIYTLTAAEEAQGYIYGLLAKGGNLTYYIAVEQNAPSVTSGVISFAPKVTSLKVNKTGAAVGESITWTAAAAGGSGTLRYCFYIFKDGATVYRGSYGTARTCTYTPDAAGSYSARVYVKDSAGKSDSLTGAGVTVAAPLSITSLKADKTGAAVGESITWTAAAAGGSGTLRYCFYIFKDGAAVYRGSYGTAKTCTYTPEAAGSYTARVYVKDSSTSLSLAGAGVTVTAAAAPLSITSLKADKTGAAVGESITWTAAAAGGSGTLRYCFYIFKDGAAVYKGSYGTARTCTYTPEAAGSYTARVYVKDSSTSLSLTGAGVTVAAPLSITSLKADKTGAAVGESITWTAAAAGGSGTLRYCFYIFKDGAAVYRGSYGTARTCTYTPEAAGSYTARVYVKDSSTSLSLTGAGVTVTAAAAPLSITSLKADKTGAAVGESITWTAAAAGGSGTLRYCFYIFKDGAVVCRGSYGTAKTCTYTPEAAGSYTARVYVKDSSTSLSLNSTATTVSAPLAITGLQADMADATVGESITWTATAAGGSGMLQYCFYIFKDGKIQERGSYGTARTFTYIPEEAGVYTARVYVKDSSGTSITLNGGTVYVGEA